MREVTVNRQTNETDIKLTLNIDGAGIYENNTGVGFLNHMLDLFAKHGRFNLTTECTGDTYVDYHHSVEDIGIALGKAFSEALGDMRGVTRYGNCILPMDEALIMCAIDLSGRAYLGFDASFGSKKVGNFDCELVKEFLLGFTRNLNATIHIKQLAGENSHHIIEGIFKCLARAMNIATCIDENFQDEIPSTKGLL